MANVRLNPAAVEAFMAFNGLSQRDLAKAAGISPSYLNGMLKGVKPGSAPTWKKLAEVMHVPIPAIVVEVVPA